MSSPRPVPHTVADCTYWPIRHPPRLTTFSPSFRSSFSSPIHCQDSLLPAHTPRTHVMSGVGAADSDHVDRESHQSLTKHRSRVGSGHPSTRVGSLRMSTRASTIAGGSLRDYAVAVIRGKG